MYLLHQTSGIDFGAMPTKEVADNRRSYNDREASTYNIDFGASRTKADLTKGPEAETT